MILREGFRRRSSGQESENQGSRVAPSWTVKCGAIERPTWRPSEGLSDLRKDPSHRERCAPTSRETLLRVFERQGVGRVGVAKPTPNEKAVVGEPICSHVETRTLGNVHF